MIKVNGKLTDKDPIILSGTLVYTSWFRLFDALVDEAGVDEREAGRIASILGGELKNIWVVKKSPHARMFREDHPSLTAFERNKGLK